MLGLSILEIKRETLLYSLSREKGYTKTTKGGVKKMWGGREIPFRGAEEGKKQLRP